MECRQDGYVRTQMFNITKISAKHDRAIVALLTTPTVVAAALDSKISAMTLRRWLKEPVFLDAYRQARHDAMQRTIAYLQGYCSDFVRVLHDIAMDEDAPKTARVAACKVGLESALRSTEYEELSSRLQRLEEGRMINI